MLDLGKLGYKIFMDDGMYRKSLQSLLGESQKTAGAISGMFSKLAGMVGIGAMFWKSAAGAKALSREIANIRSIAGELDARKLRTELMNLNAQLGDTAELANAVYYAYSAGVRGTEAELVKFTGQIAALAKTVGSGVTPIMDAVTTMMNAYGLKVQDAGKLTDWFYQIVKSGKTTGPELANALGQIASTAAGAGIKLEELGGAIATLTTTMPTAVAITALGASIRAILNPGEDAQKMASKLGIELGAAAIRAKGLQGVLNDIYSKTNGDAGLIGQLIPDARASKALTALAGTQNKTLNQVVQEFGSNSGEAAKKFSDAIAASDAAKWDAMLIVVKKLGTAVGEMTFQVLTLGGALNGMYEWFFSLNAASIQTLAKIGALTAGMFGLSKAIKLLKGGGASFLGMAIRGGYRSDEMLKAERTDQFERKKTLIVERNNAVRMALEQRRHYHELKNAAESAKAVAASENAKLAAKQRSLAVAQLNEANRYEQWTMTGTGTYVPGREIIVAQKQFTEAQQAADAAAKTAQTARTAADNANAAYRQASGAALTASNAVRMHNIAVKSGTVQVGLLRGAWNGFTAAVAANPIGFVLTAVTIAVSGLIWLLESAKGKAEDMKRVSEEAAEAVMKSYDRNEGQRDKNLADMVKLDELSRMQELSNGEMEEAEGIITRLKRDYGSFNASVDKSTKSIRMNGDEIQKLIETMRNARVSDLEKVFNVKSEKEIAARARFAMSLDGRNFDLTNRNNIRAVVNDKNGNFTAEQKKLAREYLDAMNEKEQAAYEYAQANNGLSDDKLSKAINDRIKKLESESKGFTRRWDEELLTDEDRKARSYQRDFDNYKKIIDARKALDRNYSESQYQLDLQNAQRRLSMLKDQNAAEAKARNTLLKKQADAWKDGKLTDQEKYDLKEAEIAGMDEPDAFPGSSVPIRAAVLLPEAVSAVFPIRRSVHHRAAGELKTMTMEQFYQESEKDRQIVLQERKNALGGNGPLTDAEEIELKKLEIRQQTARIEELIERREQAQTEEQRRQLSLQLAQAQSKRQELDYELKAKREKQAADEAEYRRSLALLELQTKHKADGEITHEERRSELALKLEQQRERVAELTKRAQEETNQKLRQQLNLSLAQAKDQLGSLLVEQRNLQPQRQVQGSFSASVLARMSEPNPVDRQQLTELRKIEKNTKGSTIKYGS